MLIELSFTANEAAFITELTQQQVQRAFDDGWFADPPRRRLRGLQGRRLDLSDLLHLRIIKETGAHVVWQSEAKRKLHWQLRERLPDVILLQSSHLAAEITLRVKRTEGHPAHFGRPAGEQPTELVAARQSHAGIARPWEAWLERLGERLREPVRLDQLMVDTDRIWREIADRFSEMAAARLAVVSDPQIRGGEPVVRGTRIPVHMLQELVSQGAEPKELLEDYPSLDAEKLRLALLYASTHPRTGRPGKKPWDVRAPA